MDKQVYDKMRPQKEYENILGQREIDGKAFSAKYAGEFVAVDCPACGGKGKKRFKKYGFNHNVCEMCETLYCSPRPTETLLEQYYNLYPSPMMWTNLLVQADEERKKVQYGPRAEYIVKNLIKNGCRPGGIGLDLGAGGGTFALCLKETGFFKDVICLDFSQICVEVCLKKGLTAILGDLNEIEPESIDLITMNDLIEHVYAPNATLTECWSKIKPGGFVSIATPNCMGLDFIILKEKTRNITPPEHLTYFNPKSLKILLNSCGFIPVLMETPGKLDVQIIQKEIQKGFIIEDKNEFLHLLFQQDEKTLSRFQEFIAQNLFSSHMLCLSKKERC